MSERDVRKVRPRHSIEFVDPTAVPELALNPQVPNFTHRESVPYKDLGSGEGRLVVISSDDERLVREMSEVARRFRENPISDEDLAKILSIYTTRLPVASTVYGSDGLSHINCEEPSCRFHVGGGCTNEDVRIQDDCGDAQWCMTYEPDAQDTR